MGLNTSFRLPCKATGSLHGSPAITRPGKQGCRFKLRPLWLRVHRCLALTVGFLFVLIGLTGSLNVFSRELDDLLNPELAREHTLGASRHSYDEILQIVRAVYPRAVGSWTVLPSYHPSGMLRLAHHWQGAPEVQGLMVEVDPYTGEVVKSRFWGKTLMSWIYDLHSSLQMGETGYKVLGIIGLFLMGSLITGVYLWWPRGGKWRQAFTLKRGASPERWVFDIHKLCGISSVSVLFILAFTGGYFHYGDYLHPLLNWFSPIREKPPFTAPEGLTSKVIPGAATLSITQAIAIGRQRFPNAELKVITTPEEPAGVYELRMRQPGEVNVDNPSSMVWIDRYSGEVLHERDPNRFTAGETFLNLMWPLHNGEALRLPGRILVCITGFVPLVLYVTGIIRWLQKRRAAKQLKTRLEQKISRGLQDA